MFDGLTSLCSSTPFDAVGVWRKTSAEITCDRGHAATVWAQCAPCGPWHGVRADVRGGAGARARAASERDAHLVYHAQPLQPAQRRRRRGVAEALEAARRVGREQEPVLEIAAAHQRVDEALAAQVEAEAEQREQGRMPGRAEELHLAQHLRLGLAGRRRRQHLWSAAEAVSAARTGAHAHGRACAACAACAARGGTLMAHGVAPVAELSRAASGPLER